jgi:hypothetical protein
MTSALGDVRRVRVPPERVLRWLDNFAARHGDVGVSVDGGCLQAVAADGAVARLRLPFERLYGGPPEAAAFAAQAATDRRWGVLLVRKGGFAVAALDGAEPLATKVGQRHVQGRTKAGGQSQQRFARRRDNQARQAYQAAADHAHRILVLEHPGSTALVCGGDRTAVDTVLADARLGALTDRRVEPWLSVPDPNRRVLDAAVVDGRSVSVTLTAAP